MESLITVGGVAVSYGHRKVLDSVELGVGRGEIVGLIGMNGAGKSTLVGVLSGQLIPQAGDMTLDGEHYSPDSLEAAQAAGVGIVVQNFAPDPEATVTKMLFRNTFRAKESHEALRGRALELVASAGVELDVDAVVGDLDRGLQALVEVIRMLAEEAQFVVMDEVAATLADHEIAVLHHVMRQLAAQGRGILYITHRLDELLSVADRVVLMSAGKIAGARSARNTTISDLATLLTGSYTEDHRPDPLRPVSGSAPAVELVDASLDGCFSDVHLHVRRGEILALVGNPHSGVREIAEVLAGRIAPTSGTVLREGWPLDYKKSPEELGIGYLTDSVTPADDAQRLVESVPGAKSMDTEIRRARRMIELVQELRIRTTDINARLDELSGGDRQKSALVSKFEGGHEVLVLVHPSRGIDVVSRRTVFQALKRMAEDGVAVIVLTSDMSEVMQWADRAVVVRDGGIVLNVSNQDLDEDTLVAQMLGQPIYAGTARRSR